MTATAPVVAAATALCLLVAAAARAEDRQVRPFVGVTFAGDTTFVAGNLESAADNPHLTLGVNAAWLGELFGVEADIADVPGAFESTGSLVVGSRVSTFTGNLVFTLPRRWTEYSLRPYVIAGGGAMRLRATTRQNVFDVTRTLGAFDVGGGAIGFFTNRVGVCWDVRRFQSVGGQASATGITIGDENLSFWRATMALVVRY